MVPPHSSINRRQFHLALGRVGLGGLAATYGFAAASRGEPTGLDLPRASDVVLSPRSVREEALPVADAFQPTRVEWHYARSADFIAELRARGVRFVSGTINSTDVPGAETTVGLDGSPNIAPWMRGWGRPFVRSSSAQTQRALGDWVQRNLDLGVDGIVFDDPLPMSSAERWAGGDFSAETQAGFVGWLRAGSGRRGALAAVLRGAERDAIRDYLARAGIHDLAGYRAWRDGDPMLIAWRNYLLDADIALVRGLRARRYARISHPPFAANLNTPYPSEQAERLVPLLDYLVSEISTDRLLDLAVAANLARKHGRPLVASARAVSRDTRTIRHAVATAYAVGAVPLIPWDVYVPPHDRYFGRTADFLPLFDFFRRYARLLSDYRPHTRVGVTCSIGQTTRHDFNAAVDACLRWGLPWRIVTCGGELEDRAIRREELRGLEMVIDPAPTGSLSAANTAAVARAGVSLHRGHAGLQPHAHAWFSDPSSGWRVLERRSDIGGRALFIVPQRFGAPALADGMRLNLSSVPPQPGRLLTPGREHRAVVDRDGVVVLPTIDLFGILLLGRTAGWNREVS